MRTVDDDRQNNWVPPPGQPDAAGLMQPDLFDVGERIVYLPSQSRMKLPCTPYAPGTGPEGETCGTCKHKAYQSGTAGHYIKCGKMRGAWTRGSATDIRARWPACHAWEERDADPPKTPRQQTKDLTERIKTLTKDIEA